MERGALLYTGKAKMLYATPDPDLLIQHFRDDATAFNGIKKGVIADKGPVNCGVSARLFRLVEKHGIKTHFVRLLSDRDMLVRHVKIVPLEVVIRNRIAGSLAKRFGLEEGKTLDKPLLEFFLKDDPLGDPLVTREHIRAFGWADDATVDELGRLGLKVNEIMQEFWASIGVSLVDFKLEFGRASDGTLLLADEITPDGARLWEIGTDRKMDKDRFRRDLGKVEETYAEIANKVAAALPLENA
jgi:phosphoribosylaminoimidazole-succinocarboxamide synthase